jgi:hypothetical protein
MTTTPATRQRTLTGAVAVWITLAYTSTIDGAQALWRRLGDDTGVEDSPTKLIYLAIAVAVAIAAGVFIISVFNDAQSGVPDPVAPSP